MGDHWGVSVEVVRFQPQFPLPKGLVGNRDCRPAEPLIDSSHVGPTSGVRMTKVGLIRFCVWKSYMLFHLLLLDLRHDQFARPRPGFSLLAIAASTSAGSGRAKTIHSLSSDQTRDNCGYLMFMQF